MSYNLWFEEFLNKQISQKLAIKNIVYFGRTKYQEICILDTFSYGRCLVLDGKLQSSEADEFIYHEALVHPAMLSHPSPKSVFIAGGGEGATLREVLSHKTVERVLMVDIDEEVVRLCKQFLPSLSRGAFSDPRAQIVFSEAREYLSSTKEKFDIFILDLTDPIEGGLSYPLFTREFYKLVKDHLNPSGLLVTQAGPCHLPSFDILINIYRNLSAVFDTVLPYQTEIPSFGGGWGFILAGDGVEILGEGEIERRISERINKELLFYDGFVHKGMFSLPKYIRRMLKEERWR